MMRLLLILSSFVDSPLPRLFSATREASGSKRDGAQRGPQCLKTVTLHGDRAWTLEEYKNAQKWADTRALDKFKEAITIAREMGLRVSEVVCMRRHQAVNALKTGMYHVGKEAKNGRERDVPINERAREVLERLVQNTKPGQRIFVPDGKKAGDIRQLFERLMDKMRQDITTERGQTNRNDNKITWHGLRYMYAQNRLRELYTFYRRQGLNRRDSMTAAKHKLTRELGHNRVDVLKVYLQGVSPGENPDPEDQ